MVETDVLFRIADAAEDDDRLDFARQLFERGAALGNVECLTRLARLHDAGLGTSVNKREAMRLFRQAWRQGSSVVAANNIAILYREVGNHRAMFRWFQRAADAGDGSAQLDLAKCYLEALGVRGDSARALRCLAVAIQSIYITEAQREEAVILMEGLAPHSV